MMQVNLEDAIIFPKKGKGSPHLGPVAVIAGTQNDLSRLCELMGFDGGTFHELFTSRLYIADQAAGGVSIAGPAVGAPYAVMVLEMLIAWGARKIFFMGWCGSISKKVQIGDIIMPSAAVIDEGTSRHYQKGETRLSYPSEPMVTRLRAEMNLNQLHYHSGTLWSTDAIFRETPKQVEYYQHQGAIAVDMEISALFTVARFRQVDLAAVAVVSDELGSFKWRPGFKRDEFKRSRTAVCKVIKDVCQKM